MSSGTYVLVKPSTAVTIASLSSGFKRKFGIFKRSWKATLLSFSNSGGCSGFGSRKPHEDVLNRLFQNPIGRPVWFPNPRVLYQYPGLSQNPGSYDSRNIRICSSSFDPSIVHGLYHPFEPIESWLHQYRIKVLNRFESNHLELRDQSAGRSFRQKFYS